MKKSSTQQTNHLLLDSSFQKLCHDFLPQAGCRILSRIPPRSGITKKIQFEGVKLPYIVPVAGNITPHGELQAAGGWTAGHAEEDDGVAARQKIFATSF